VGFVTAIVPSALILSSVPTCIGIVVSFGLGLIRFPLLTGSVSLLVLQIDMASIPVERLCCLDHMSALSFDAAIAGKPELLTPPINCGAGQSRYPYGKSPKIAERNQEPITGSIPIAEDKSCRHCPGCQPHR